MQRHFLRLTAATAALGVAVALAGCGAPGEAGAVTLNLIAADYDVNGGQSSRTYWDDVVHKFEATHDGINVEVHIEPWTSIDRKVAQLVKRDQAPDIAQIGAYADYAADDKLYSADELLSIPVQSNFLAPLVAAGKQRRVQYGLPFTASTRLLFYNKDHFKKAGIAKPPQTWEELSEAARLLKANTKVSYPIALPLGPEEAQAETMVWLLGAGTDGYVDAGGVYAIDSDENTSALEWLKSDLVDQKLTGPVAPGKLNRKEAFAAFTRGEVGMLNGHPSLMKSARAAGVDVGMVTMPGRAGRSNSTMGVADWIMGFKQNGHQAEIGDFLNFLFTDENVLNFAAQNALLPVTTSASEAMEDDAQHADLKPFLDELPESVLPPVDKTSWATVSDEVKRNIGNAVKPGGSPRQVLEDIAQKATEAEQRE
ncbi:extracellular solute-binding protein [Streptomyces sp. NPDC005963]|uniref:extracellular solute-binding protein n=1 Tax=Streptomyces sp. NPDC005963 TaxID=3156721 RepID=UPI0033C5FC22